MTKYRKKPVVIDAVQFTGQNVTELRDFVGSPNFATFEDDDESGIVAGVWDRLHSTWVGVKTGQWIIRGVQGETYPCADDVFRATYEQADELDGGAELQIPDAVLRRAADAGFIDGDPCDAADDIADLRGIAAPVVAAELRRLADSFDAIAKGSHGWAIGADAASLRTRADELDGGAGR